MILKVIVIFRYLYRFSKVHVKTKINFCGYNDQFIIIICETIIILKKTFYQGSAINDLWKCS